VALPRCDETAADYAANVNDASLLRGGENSQSVRVLLTDDSPDNRLLIRAHLKDPRYDLDEAENGAIAVEKVKTRRNDVVLIGIQMPVMDGLTATRLICEWESESLAPHTPIVALTASALEEDVRRTLEAGADRHLSKPVRKKMLIATIESLALFRSPAANRRLH
jgi:CheY-like chemotaxis protein